MCFRFNLQTLEDALKNRRNNSKLILHSDLRLHRTLKACEKALNLNKIEHSVSSKRCPYDNTETKSFHALLKKGHVCQQEV